MVLILLWPSVVAVAVVLSFLVDIATSRRSVDDDYYWYWDYWSCYVHQTVRHSSRHYRPGVGVVVAEVVAIARDHGPLSS